MKDLAPLIILSAAPRMGTTLVQRLLCSARDCLIYGDTVGNDAAFLVSWLSSKQFAIRSQAGRFDPMLEAVLAGDTSEFIADLSPESEGYLDRLEKVAAGPLIHCQAEARGHGRSIWGWKHAGAQSWFIGMLPGILPKARIICVDRDLADTVRSAKAVQLVGPGADFQRFVSETIAARSAIASLAGRLPVFNLKLQDLLEDTEKVVSDLESFAGCSRINREVISVKVNHPNSPWIPPMALTAEEEAYILQFKPRPDHAVLA